MDGYAVTWYENNCLWGTFAAFEAAFRAKFHTMAKKGQAYQMACSYKQEPGETVEDAISTLTRLFMTADIDDDKIMCDTLLRALDRDIALVVLRQNPANYQTMCDLVITEGKVLAPLDALRTQHVRPLHGPLRGKLDDLSKQILELHLTLMETNGMVSRLADRCPVNPEKAKKTAAGGLYSVTMIVATTTGAIGTTTNEVSIAIDVTNQDALLMNTSSRDQQDIRKGTN
ncbi:hypothetical protein BGX31_006501 [Mortierella sp. GBA43]|nr:hypothetical protein BGX31_006501 [Mortierella sp. GBA43]